MPSATAMPAPGAKIAQFPSGLRLPTCVLISVVLTTMRFANVMPGGNQIGRGPPTYRPSFHFIYHPKTGNSGQSMQICWALRG